MTPTLKKLLEILINVPNNLKYYEKNLQLCTLKWVDKELKELYKK